VYIIHIAHHKRMLHNHPAVSFCNIHFLFPLFLLSILFTRYLSFCYCPLKALCMYSYPMCTGADFPKILSFRTQWPEYYYLGYISQNILLGTHCPKYYCLGNTAPNITCTVLDTFPKITAWDTFTKLRILLLGAHRPKYCRLGLFGSQCPKYYRFGNTAHN
jgi:hypothetical protein